MHDRRANSVPVGYTADATTDPTLSDAFDSQGRLRHFTETDGTNTYDQRLDYNSANQLSSVTQNQVNGAAVTYAYYPTDGSASSGKIKTMKVLQSGAVVSKTDYTYDSTGRLSAETVTAADGSAQTFTYAYRSGTDLIQSVTTSGGVTTTYGYETVDGGNQLSSVATTDTSSSPLIYADGYTTYTSGQRHTATVQRRGSADTSWTYGYDSSNQLTSAAATGGTAASYSYSFDGAGNRTDLGPVNNLDQYTNFTYDTRGNLIDDTVNTYGYDPLDRLISVTPKSPSAGSVKMTMGYDSQDRRIWKKTFAWDASLNGGAGDWSATAQQYLKFAYEGMNLVAEFSSDGTTDTLLQTYAWGQDLGGGIGGLLSITDFSGSTPKTYLPFYDGNGNVTGLTDASTGQVAATYDYDPFGNLTASSGPAANVNPFRFSTKYFDTETGLYNFGYRFYSPTQGRFITRDPSGEFNGGANLYAFVQNDPVNGIDAYGLSESSYINDYASYFQGIGERASASELATLKSLGVDELNTSLPGIYRDTGTGRYYREGSVIGTEDVHVPLLAGDDAASRILRVLSYLPFGPDRERVDTTTTVALIEVPDPRFPTASELDEYTRSRVDFIKTVQAIGSTLEGVTSFATDFVPGFGQVKGLTEAATGKSILNSKTRLSTGQRVAGGIVAALAATKVASWISEFNGTPKWLERVREGIKFDEAQKVRYPYNQVYVYGKTTDYLKLDSYNPQLGEIVSRKFTQLAEVNESTAINYIREMTAKYAPGTKLANVPTNGALVGQVLRGQIILEVPVQNGPIPQTILEAANKARLIIRDINGKVY